MATTRRANSTALPAKTWVRVALTAALIVFVSSLLGLLVWKNADLVHGLGNVMAVVLLTVVALMVTSVLSGILGAAGIWQTKAGRVTGAGAVFLSTMGAEISTYRALQTDDGWIMAGVVAEMPTGTKAKALVSGKLGPCEALIDPTTGMFQMRIRPDCETDPLAIELVSSGNRNFSHSVSKQDAAKPVRIPWQALPTVITGRVFEGSKAGPPVRNALVAIDKCGAADPTDENGAFKIDIAGRDCGVFPLRVIVEEGGRRATDTIAHAADNRLELPVVIRVESKRPAAGFVEVGLNRAPPPGDAVAFAIGQGLWTPRETGDQVGRYFGLDDIKTGSSVVVRALDRADTTDRVRALPKLDEQQLKALVEALPGIETPRELLGLHYKGRAQALSNAEDCTGLMRQAALVKDALVIRPNDGDLAQLRMRNLTRRQVAGCEH